MKHFPWPNGGRGANSTGAWGVTDQFTKHRFLMQAGYDAAVWMPSVALATLFRYEFSF